MLPLQSEYCRSGTLQGSVLSSNDEVTQQGQTWNGSEEHPLIVCVCIVDIPLVCMLIAPHVPHLPIHLFPFFCAVPKTETTCNPNTLYSMPHWQSTCPPQWSPSPTPTLPPTRASRTSLMVHVIWHIAKMYTSPLAYCMLSTIHAQWERGYPCRYRGSLHHAQNVNYAGIHCPTSRCQEAPQTRVV